MESIPPRGGEGAREGGPPPAKSRGVAWRPPSGWAGVRSALTVGLGVAIFAVLGLFFRGTGGYGIGVGGFFAPRIEAPEPELSDFDEAVPEVAPSVLTVPIAYDLTPVFEMLEARVPRSLGSLAERRQLESNDRVSVAYELTRSPFNAAFQGETARLSSVISYKARAWYDARLLPEVRASCGTGEDPPPRIRVGLSARLTIGEDWGLKGRTRIDRLQPYTDEDRDKCRITPLNIDVTERVIGAAQSALVDHLPAIEASLQGIDLRSRFERWWAALQEPISLDDNLWLVIDPIEVHRGPASGTGQALQAVVSLTAKPHVVLGDRPTIDPRPLPPLDTASVTDGLRIQAEGTLDYQAASARLNEALEGHELELPGGTIRLGSLSVRGIGAGRLALEMTFSGSAKGRLFLMGTPEFDPESRMIHVPDLEFDVASRSLLVQGLDWMAHPSVLETLRERARWETDDVVALAEQQLNRGLNRALSDDVRLIGSVESVDVTGLYPQRDHLVVHASAAARARLVIVEADSAVASP